MKTQTDKNTDCKVPWCNRQSQVNDERCSIHSEVHKAYRSASVVSDSPNQSNETRPVIQYTLNESGLPQTSEERRIQHEARQALVLLRSNQIDVYDVIAIHEIGSRVT